MSLILDALKRSDRSREDGNDVPGLQTRHGESRRDGAAGWQRWVWPLLAAVCAAIALVSWLNAGSGPTPPPASVREPSQGDAGRATAEGTTMPPDAGESAAVAAAPATPDKQDARIAALYARPAAPGAESDAAPDPVADAAPAPAADEAAVASNEPTLDVDALTARAEELLETLEPENEEPAEHPAPFIADLQQSTKDAIPSVFYQSHRWSSDRRESNVVLNGDTLREGDSASNGLEVIEILPDSVVLDYRGTQFRLRSLNSWVNL